MNTKGTNPGMNVEDYEDMAVKNSNTAKRVAAGAALFAGGAVVAGGAAYAATNPGPAPEPIQELTTDDIVKGAEAGSTEETPVVEEHVTEKVVYVEKPVEEPKEPTVTWDETTNVYVDGEKVASVEEGTYDGHRFALTDVDGDGDAEVLAIDLNNNGKYEEYEKTYFSDSDNVRMGHETAHANNHYFYETESGELVEDPNYVAQNEEVIHNNFEDEKTGEAYRGDYAENNPDYNNRADVDYESKEYLAENDKYDTNDGNYSASMDDNADTYTAEDYVEEETAEDNYTAEVEEDSSYDEMMGGEEFLG